jgi:hypothetical protein
MLSFRQRYPQMLALFHSFLQLIHRFWHCVVNLLKECKKQQGRTLYIPVKKLLPGVFG